MEEAIEINMLNDYAPRTMPQPARTGTVDIRIPEIRLQRDGVIEVRDRLRPLVTMRHVHNAAAVVRFRIVGPQCNRPGVIAIARSASPFRQ